MAKVYQTPGVYIEEGSAFPNSAVPVATAVPAFIGYTEKAIRDKKPLLLKPTKISSYGEYLMFFGKGPQTKLTVAASAEPGVPYALTISESHFTLHSQMKMFFINGGSDCYIVSVGGYTKEDGTPNAVEAAQLEKGIAPLLKEIEPTILLIPELTTIALDRDDNGNVNLDDVKALYGLYGQMLNHCGVVMRNRFAVMDVWMDREKYTNDGYDIDRDINTFRESVNSPALAWGATYYPWLQTTAVPITEISVLNVANLGTVEQVQDFTEGTFNEKEEIADTADFATKFLAAEVDSLVSLLDKTVNQGVADGEIKRKDAITIKDLLKDIPGTTAKTAHDTTRALTIMSPIFKSLVKDIQQALNLLPPSASMAGIYAMVDNTVGVFQSPANVGVGAVIKPAVNISNDQQEDMNIPINGKAVNAIRSFPGKGVLVWGARTLDGNSQDWRYISVRRTVIFIEQSIKLAAEPYVFEPNTASTWSNMKALIVNFLTNVWQSGALAGATAEDAFSVEVGLGSTMTPVDILDGYMRISVKIAVTRPAEFIVINFEQKMQQA
ncbi:MAG: phage tail sheath C-terminal domain-containing protein [Bacteroidota bacterium]